MIQRSLALACLSLLAVLPAAAQDIEFGTDRAGASAAARAGEREKALEKENAALKEELAEEKKVSGKALDLAAVNEKIAVGETRLRHLAEEERDAYKAKAARLERERGKGRFWLTVQARGAMGGLVCSPVGLTGGGLPIVAGCAVVGGIIGAVEALVE